MGPARCVCGAASDCCPHSATTTTGRASTLSAQKTRRARRRSLARSLARSPDSEREERQGALASVDSCRGKKKCVCVCVNGEPGATLLDISVGRMFQLASLSDSAVKIAPANLGKSTLEAVTQELESLYVDKVLPECGGLVVTLYSIKSIQGGAVLAGEGCVCFDVTFDVVLFKPFIGEVLEGTLTSADASGAHVSVGFFHDVFVSPSDMQYPSEFDESEGVWVWDYDGSKMDMCINEKVRFKVKGVRFPDLPKTAEELSSLTFEAGAKTDGSFAPMLLIGNMNEDGLGLCSWWDEEGDHEDDHDHAVEE